MPATRIWALALTSIGSLMVALDTLVVSTALSTIRLDLTASLADLEWTVNAYNLSLAVLLMTTAALGDRFGRRRMYAGGLALFTLASAACAVAPSIGWLIAGRAAQGIGAAFVLPLALALLTAAFPPDRRGTALGVFSGLTGLAVASGPLIGGAVAEGLSWQWIFWLNVPIGIIAIPLVLSRLDESHGPDTALDLRGVALVTGGAFGLVWGLVRANSVGWSSLEIVAALSAGILLIAIFVVWESHVDDAMLPLRFFRSRAFSAGNAAIFLLFGSLFGAVFFLAQFLQTALGYGPFGAGVRLLPWVLTLFFVAPVAGALADRVGERPFLVVGLTLQAIGMAWIGLIADPGLSYGNLVAPMVVSGCGISMAIPSGQNAVIGDFATASLGKVSGTNSMMRELGGVFGIAVIVAAFASTGSYASPATFSEGFSVAIIGSAALALIGAVAGLFVSGRRLDPVPVPLASELETEGVA